MAKVLGALFFLLAASLANAQTIDPQFVEFVPSADQDATLSDGTPIVSRYDLEFYVAGGQVPLQVLDIGKPVPAADGLIHVSFAPSWPASGTVYEARVAAVGPSGLGESGVSNTFSFSGGCAYQVSPTSVSVVAAGGTGSVDVLTGGACTWTPISSASWVTITSQPTTGNGTLTFSVAPNTGSARSATLTAGNASVAVTQNSGACNYSVSPTSLSFSAAGTPEGLVSVTAPAGCTWTASSQAPWVVLNGSSGSGTLKIAYSVNMNSGANRASTLTVAGILIPVSEAGTNCSFAVSPTSISAPASGTSGSLALTTQTGCAWTATSSAAWLTLASGSGTGSTSLGYTVAANTLTTPRTATLTVGGVAVSVTQAGVACSFSASPSTISALSGGGSGNVTLTTQTGCAWTATSSAAWVTVAPASGTNSASLAYAVAANTLTTPRTATLTVGGVAVSVTQAGAACSFSASPSTISALSGGGSGNVTLTTQTGCAWTATSSAAWITVAPASGTDSASLAYAVAANTLTTPRTATLTVGGAAVSVTQAGVACSFSASPSTVSAASGGGSGNVTLTTQTGCAWTATSSAAWLTVAPASGTDSASLGYTVAANTTSSVRSGTLTIGGKLVAVTQAANCAFAVSPSNVTAPVASTTGTIGVTTTAGCAWTASSPVSWISLSVASGTGSMNFSFSISANASTASRSATLAIAGKSIVVMQVGQACTYTLSDTRFTENAAAGGGSVAVVSGTGCNWSASNNANWITVGSTGTKTGNDSISFSTTANGTGRRRKGTFTVAGQTVTVNQN